MSASAAEIVVMIMPILPFLIERSWVGPATMFSSIMSLSVLGGSLFAPEYYLSSEALMVVAIFSSVSVIGSTAGYVLAGGLTEFRAQGSHTANVSQRRILFVGFSSSVLGLIFLLGASGITVPDLLSLDRLMRTAQLITRDRYEGGFRVPLAYSITNSILVSYMLILGYLKGIGSRVTIVHYIPFVLFCIGNLIITTRAPIIFVASVYLFGFVYGNTIIAPDLKPIRILKVRTLLFGGAVILGVIGLFYFVQIVRFGDYAGPEAENVFHHLRKWPFGSLPAFSIWWDSTEGGTSGVIGYYTFTGILDNLGIAGRVKGGYDEYITLAPGERGNVYTVMRGLITDFGFIGGLLFMGSLSAAGGYAFRAMRSGSDRYFHVYAAVMCFMLWSFVISFYSFTSHVVGFLLAPILFAWSSRDSNGGRRL